MLKFSKIFCKFLKITSILNFPTLFKILFKIFLHFNIVSKFYSSLLKKFYKGLKLFY